MPARSAVSSFVPSPVTDAERLRARHRPSGAALLRQRWENLGFLHWSTDPEALGALIPRGLDLDTWDGRAYVGIVPFTIRGSRAAFLPPVPGLSRFHELNLRTYVHRRGQDPGVLFFSLDAGSRLAAWAARASYRLPYHAAEIHLERRGEALVFSSVRRGSAAQASFSCTYWPIARPRAALPGTLEFFLAERYRLYSWDGLRLRSARVWHAPYPLAAAHAEDVVEELASASRIVLPACDQPIVHYAAEVDVRIYAPSVVPRGALPPPEPSRATR